MEKRSAGVLILCALCAVSVSASAQSGISSQIVNSTKITHIGTTLNHVSVIELPEPVESAVIGSDYVRMEYRGSTVLIEPLKAGVSTDLFVWTAHTRTTYEIQPAGDNSALSYAVREEYPAPPPPPPGPTPQEAERERDKTYGPFILTARAISTPHLNMNKPGIHIKIEQVAEDANSYYVRIFLVNQTAELYRVQNPEVFHLAPTFGEKMALRSVNEQLTDRKFAKVISYDASVLRTHGSTLEPGDLRSGQSAEWVVAIGKTEHRPAMYQFLFPSAGGQRVQTVVVF